MVGRQHSALKLRSILICTSPVCPRLTHLWVFQDLDIPILPISNTNTYSMIFKVKLRRGVLLQHPRHHWILRDVSK